MVHCVNVMHAICQLRMFACYPHVHACKQCCGRLAHVHACRPRLMPADAGLARLRILSGTRACHAQNFALYIHENILLQQINLEGMHVAVHMCMLAYIKNESQY